MKKILILKPSSFGDIVHVFAAVADVIRKRQDVEVHWLVDDQYHDIPKWSRHVDRVFAINRKRLRRFDSFTFGMFSRFVIQKLKRENYDLILDFYFGWQDAKLVQKIGAPFVGPTRSMLEVMKDDPRIAGLYARTVDFDPTLPSVLFYRTLMAKAVGYELDTLRLKYDVDLSHSNSGVSFQGPYVVFVHSTSGAAKNWPLEYWERLAEFFIADGVTVVLPWGSEEEKVRAQKIVNGRPEIVLLPGMTLKALAVLITESVGVIGGDTGLTHIASILAVPTVRIFGATSSNAAVPSNEAIDLCSSLGCSPCMNRNSCERNDIETFSVYPPCYENIAPEKVFLSFKQAQQLSVAALR